MDRPLHDQIAANLRQRIAEGHLSVGSPLPSEAQLGDQWRTSRGPIRQALAALRAEGLIGGGRGKPPVVQRQTLSQPFDTFLSFSRWADDLGHTPGQRTLEVALRPASASLAELLEVDEGEPVVQLLRLRLLDGQPTMIERSTFVEHIGRALFDHDCDSGSIYAFLTGRGLEVGDARHVIDAVGADEIDVDLLDLAPGAPLLRERRLARTADGEPFEFSDDRYRPDIASFVIHNRPQAPLTLSRTWQPPRTERRKAAP